MTTAPVNIRLDCALKNRCMQILKEQDITLTQYVVNALEYLDKTHDVSFVHKENPNDKQNEIKEKRIQLRQIVSQAKSGTRKKAVQGKKEIKNDSAPNYKEYWHEHLLEKSKAMG